MITKEKAQELVGKCFDVFINDKYEYYVETAWELAKQCALIAVDEILEATKHEYQIQYESGEWSREIGYKYSEYWQGVKEEIEKL